MGYQTRYTGEIRIAPPIPLADVAESGFVTRPGESHLDRDVALKVVEEPIPDMPGAYRRSAVAIIPAMEDAYRGYDAVSDVQEIVTRWGEGRTFTGRLNCEGEETGDLWRLQVIDDQAVRVVPRIVWPDDEVSG